MFKKLPDQKQELVVIGNGMAGMRTIEELLQIAPDNYNITVFGAEPYGNYNRIMLSPLLAGEKEVEDIMINTPAWYEENNITLYSGDPVKHIDRQRRMVHSEKGKEIPYDRLLIATGSQPFILPIEGTDLNGVISFRDIHDVDSMLEASKQHEKAVVIGGGLLGLEAAHGLHKQGMDVTVVHLMDTLMERQLDSTAGSLLQQSLEQRGLRFRMEAKTEAILGKNHVTGVRFADGSEVKADLVVMAVGIKPNKELAENCGLYCDRGIIVNDTMQTYDPRIYSVGECVQHREKTYGLVAPLWEQATVCATHLANVGSGRYSGSETSTKLKVSGVDLFSAGDILGDEDCEDVVFQDPRRGVYKRIVLKDNRVHGVVLYCDTMDSSWYFDLMKQQRDVSDIRDRLVFGRAYAEADALPGGDVESMPDDTQVCDCNGVCKGTIVETIQSQELTSQADVEKQTKAGTSCGSCKDLVGQILEATIGADAVATVSADAKPMCDCTTYSHGQVREAIREQHLLSGMEVRDALGWDRPDGCNKCRPALNYYCISTFPAEAVDDSQSRFINERAHANIQKDGTYSVVPRMWGGITNSTELRAIADVVDKYQIPTVKMTGGQRVDLLGVKKEDLPGVWRDLREKGGLQSGHAYGKALRTVKTCVGKEWCRFGLQESTKLGIELEQMTAGTWTPHKFKMAVSGCPRNCAESSIKDFGVICLETGYELQVGGNGGVKLRGTDVLCRVSTPEEVKEYCGAFMQIYREEAYYLERTAHWIERVGLDYVIKRVVNDEEGRKAAYERFLESQEYIEVDPWAERSQDKPEATPIEYVPLKEVS